MKIFLTGATGFIGSHIVPELVGAGHVVLGMTRSDAGERALSSAGAEPYRADINEVSTLLSGVEQADAVIHCAFDHDFSNFVANTEKDRRVITAMADVLAGSTRPLVITSGVGMGAHSPGEPALEKFFDKDNPNPRKASEEAGLAAFSRGVNVSVVRLPQVHDTQKQGLITLLIALAKQAGKLGYLGEGRNAYAAAPVTDVAQLYRLVVERGESGSVWNAVQEEGVPMRDIMMTLGKGLHLPVSSASLDEMTAIFGWMGAFVGMDMSASSTYTRYKLKWEPKGPGLLSDLGNMDYSQV